MIMGGGTGSTAAGGSGSGAAGGGGFTAAPKQASRSAKKASSGTTLPLMGSSERDTTPFTCTAVASVPGLSTNTLNEGD